MFIFRYFYFSTKKVQFLKFTQAWTFNFRNMNKKNEVSSDFLGYLMMFYQLQGLCSTEWDIMVITNGW
jgi:hypothetical protein